MNELPATSGGTSVQTDLSVSNSLSKPKVKFNDRMVTPSKPSQQQSVKVSGEAFGRTQSSGDKQLKLQDRSTAHVSDDAYSDPKRFEDSNANDQVLLDSFDDAETASRTSDDFVVSSSGSEISEIENDPDDMVSPPNTSFPIPVDPRIDGDTITIGNTGADNDGAINGDETITIEGGGKVNKGKFSRALKAIANWFMGLFDNKIAVGLAVFFALTFIFGLLASPVGAPLVFILMTGLAAAITCGLTGLLIADLVPDIGQQQPGNSQNPNQNNNNQSDKSFSEIDKTKSGSSSSQPNADIPDEDDTAGSFFMTPNGKKAPAPVINGGGSSPVRESQDAASAADKVDSQLEKMFGTEVFDEWLNENLLRWSNKAQFAEFSKTLRGRGDYEELAMNNKLDSLLEGLHRNSNDLSLLARSPLKELDSSGPRQWTRLNDFYSIFDEALESLKPTPYECQAMYNRLLRALPKEQFPWVSSNLYSPLLSVGYQRKSLEALSSEEVAKIEVSDMLRLALQRLDLYGRGGQQQKESDDQERLRQIQTVKSKLVVNPQDEKLPEKDIRKIETTPEPEVVEREPVPNREDSSVQSFKKGLQANLSNEDLKGNAEGRARVANSWNKEIGGLGLDWNPVDENKSGQVWFMTIKGELMGCVSALKWSSTNPFVPANATDMEKRFIEITGIPAPPTDLDKRYFEIAVEQAALAIKDKVEKTITKEQISDFKSKSSKGDQMFDNFKVAFIDSILDAPQVGSEKTMEDAFRSVSATDQDKQLIKSYIRDYLINNWIPKILN